MNNFDKEGHVYLSQLLTATTNLQFLMCLLQKTVFRDCHFEFLLEAGKPSTSNMGFLLIKYFRSRPELTEAVMWPAGL